MLGINTLLERLSNTAVMSLNKDIVVLNETEYFVLPTSFALDELLQLDYLIKNKTVNRLIKYNSNNSIIDSHYTLYKYHFYKGRNLKKGGHYIEIDYSFCLKDILKNEFNINLNLEKITDIIEFSRYCISFANGTINGREFDYIANITTYIPKVLETIYTYLNTVLKCNRVNEVFDIVTITDFRVIVIYKGITLRRDLKYFYMGQYQPQIFTGYNETYHYLRRIYTE